MKRLSTTILHRHGDRTPITDFTPSVRKMWEPHVLSPVHQNALKIRFPPHHHVGAEAAPSADPIIGHLTNTGSRQLYNLGTQLRSELADLLVNPLGEVSVKSTHYHRTIQSTQSLLLGLLAPRKAEYGTVQVHVSPRSCRMIPDLPDRTATQKRLEQEFETAEDTTKRDEELEAARQRVETSLLNEAGALRSSPSRRLSWVRLQELLVCLETYGMRPPSLRQADVDAIMSHTTWRWHAQFDARRGPDARLLCELAIGAFVGPELIEGWRQQRDWLQAKKPAAEIPDKIRIYSAHDSTLVALLRAFRLHPVPEVGLAAGNGILNALDCAAMLRRCPRHDSRYVWPEYATRLQMDLLQESHTSNLFLRFALNGAPLQQEDVSPGVNPRLVPLSVVDAELGHWTGEDPESPSVKPTNVSLSSPTLF